LSLAFHRMSISFHYRRKFHPEQPMGGSGRTKPPLESVLSPRHPGKTRTGDNVVQQPHGAASPSNRAQPARCACKSGSEPDPRHGVHYRVSCFAPH
jgi:hypothetical protein